MTFGLSSLSREMVWIVALMILYGAYLCQRALRAWRLYSRLNFKLPTRTKTLFLFSMGFLTVVAIPQTITAPVVIQPILEAGFGTPKMGPELTRYVISVWIPIGMIGLILSPFILSNLRRSEDAIFASTPYDIVANAPDNSSEKIFNFFLSYKSEDVDIVRKHADRLLANGMTVWFAEYMILLQNYYTFEDAIYRGLRQSEFGFIFTSESYFGAKWCREEVMALLKPENCGPKKMLDVRMTAASTGRKTIPGLSKVPSRKFTGNVEDIIEIQNDVMQDAVHHWLQLSNSRSQRKPYFDERLGYRLDLMGWDMYYRGAPNLTHAGYIGPAFRRKVEGNWLGLHISAGVAAESRGMPVAFDFSEEAIKRALQAAQSDFFLPFTISDDREYYKKGVDFANSWAREHRVKCVGLHLFFYGRHSHLALTYASRRGWNRRYSIVLVDPETDLSIEFALVFKFMGLFTEYCKYTAFMDGIIYSLRQWRSE